MFECRHCRELLRGPMHKLGARCPNCRMPLLERRDPSRHEPKAAGGNCATHGESPAVSRCGRCAQGLCSVCRTRWHDGVLCPSCAAKALEAGEPGLRESARRERLALWSFALALAGWTVLLVTIIPWLQLQTGHAGKGAVWILFFASLLPALIALGQGATAVRQRARRLSLATSGLILGGLQVGLMIGVLLINLWHN